MGPLTPDPIFLADVPDHPCFVEARAMVLYGVGQVFGGPGGWAVRNTEPGGRVVVVVGDPGVEVIAEALSDRPDRTVMCAEVDAATTAEALPGWSSEAAWLYRLDHPERLAPPDARVRELNPDDALDHLPEHLAEEMRDATRHGEIHTLFVDGRGVSFAYSCWETESLFDISIDTAPGWRRRGLARIAVSALIRDEMEDGRVPVWGAMESNLASQRLAESLGFVRHDAVVLFERPPADP